MRAHASAALRRGIVGIGRTASGTRLDSTNSEQIWNLLSSIARDKHATVLMVTHEAVAAAYADRVLVLKDGVLIGQIDSKGDGDAAMVAARYQELAR